MLRESIVLDYNVQKYGSAYTIRTNDYNISFSN